MRRNIKLINIKCCFKNKSNVGDKVIKKVSLEKAVEIYKERIEKDFPPEEIPPLSVFEKCIKEGIFECYTFDTEVDGNKYTDVGYLVIRKVNDVVFIMVLAIDDVVRGKGLGKKMLNEFKSFSKENFNIIILEAENPEEKDVNDNEKEVREKRIKFYTDLGFKVTQKLKYLLVKIDYKILYYCLNDESKILSPEEVIVIMEDVYKDVLRNRDWLEMKVEN